MTDRTPDEIRALLDGATPGPWEAEHRGFDVYETQTEHGDVVAECGLLTADARLIAAAPDLAAQCLRLLAALDVEGSA